MFDHGNVFHMSIFSFLIFHIYLLCYLQWCINTSELYHVVASYKADREIAQLPQGCMRDLIREDLSPRCSTSCPLTCKLDLPERLKVN